MDEAIKKLVENQVFSEDVKNALIEAWNSKLKETKQTLEEQIRSEFATRYKHDKSQLVEAMDKFLGEELKKEMTEFVEDRKRMIAEQKASTKEKKVSIKQLNDFVVENLKKEISELAEDKKIVFNERIKLSKAVTEARKEYKEKLGSHLRTIESFVGDNLKKEISELVADKKELSRKLRESRESYKAEFAERLNTLEQFVMKQLTEELSEFEEDKKLLAERRVQLEKEARNKLDETQKTFIKKASRLVEDTMLNSIKTEMSQLKNDLKSASQNNFGRRIFEAFAAEYMTSYLTEGTEVKKLENALNESKKRINALTKEIAENNKAIEASNRKIRMVEDRAERTKVLADLLAPLPKDQKVVMSNLLESVKTDKLNETFKKYLPSVLGSERVEKRAERAPLVENKINISSNKTITGDRINKLTETIEKEKKGDNQADILELKKLAGLE